MQRPPSSTSSPRTTSRLPFSFVLTLAFAVMPLLGAACTQKAAATPADATCEGMCSALPVCAGSSYDQCLSSCKSEQVECATEYRSSNFQETLACLTNADYSCSVAHDGTPDAPTTGDCPGASIGYGSFDFTCN